ncbi:MAG: arsenate reductase ArsC [Actinobacteria bacterium]|nr:arsenate reductase ArsC [Actinomycetota bacterium]
MKQVLFVCVHNAGRSVMAEALFNRLADGRAEALSAGTEPSGRAHPEVVEAMRELDIDVSGHEGSLLTDELVASAERVITMGCAVDTAACPAILYRDVEDWALPDPKGRPLEEVRRIRDEIERRVRALLQNIEADPLPE